jgi:hypothetical protein
MPEGGQCSERAACICRGQQSSIKNRRGLPSGEGWRARQRFVVDVLHRQVCHPFRVADAIDAAEIGVRDVTGEANLISQALPAVVRNRDGRLSVSNPPRVCTMSGLAWRVSRWSVSGRHGHSDESQVDA